jgi:hypothetical protein
MVKTVSITYNLINSISNHSHAVNDVHLRLQCYRSFKLRHKENWKDILDLHEEAELNDNPGQSRAKRARTFKTTFEKIVQQVRPSI